MICGPPVSQDKSSNGKTSGQKYSYQYSRQKINDALIIDECCLPTHGPVTPDPYEDIVNKADICHNDCITDLLAVKVREKMLLSCSRDGIIKVWK